jgi:hypothetical protein
MFRTTEENTNIHSPNTIWTHNSDVQVDVNQAALSYVASEINKNVGLLLLKLLSVMQIHKLTADLKTSIAFVCQH